TSVENPLPVEENTLFQFGSTGKTFTATAMMRLVEQGKVDLNEKVRTYVPELKLKDDDVAREVTVLQLFNHTAGWQGDFFADTGRRTQARGRRLRGRLGRPRRRQRRGERGRPDRVGEVPPRRRDGAGRHSPAVAGAARPDEAADGGVAGKRHRRRRRDQLAHP